jgi:hypothetical protein
MACKHGHDLAQEYYLVALAQERPADEGEGQTVAKSAVSVAMGKIVSAKVSSFQ